MDRKQAILKIQNDMKHYSGFEFHYNSDEYYFLGTKFTEKNIRVFSEKMQELLQCWYFNISVWGERVKLSFPNPSK